jgi:hypothetical protein
LQRVGEFEFSERCNNHRLGHPSHPGGRLDGVGIGGIEGNEKAGVSVCAQYRLRSRARSSAPLTLSVFAP